MNADTPTQSKNLYIRFYYTSFLDLALASAFTTNDARNSIELIEYKSFFLQQSIEKLFKAMLLKNNKAYNPKKHNHNLLKLAEDISNNYPQLDIINTIANIYKNNLGSFSGDLKKFMLAELDENAEKYLITTNDESILFTHFCTSLEKSFFAIRVCHQLN